MRFSALGATPSETPRSVRIVMMQTTAIRSRWDHQYRRLPAYRARRNASRPRPAASMVQVSGSGIGSTRYSRGRGFATPRQVQAHPGEAGEKHHSGAWPGHCHGDGAMPGQVLRLPATEIGAVCRVAADVHDALAATVIVIANDMTPSLGPLPLSKRPRAKRSPLAPQRRWLT